MKDEVSRTLPPSAFILAFLVEASGFEPLISCVQGRRSPAELSPRRERMKDEL